MLLDLKERALPQMRMTSARFRDRLQPPFGGEKRVFVRRFARFELLFDARPAGDTGYVRMSNTGVF